jgi:hypothetical protein
MDLIIDKIFCSAYVDITKIDLDRILWPELRECRVIVVANKQGNDASIFKNQCDQLSFYEKDKLPQRADLICGRKQSQAGPSSI